MSTFNGIYYSFSPIIADYERENPIFREMVKVAITPMITSLSILNYVDMDSEESFMMNVVNPHGDEVFSSMIYVTSTSSGLINFNSHVMYIVTDDAIQSNSIASGNYEMQITDNDGNVLAFIPLQII